MAAESQEAGAFRLSAAARSHRGTLIARGCDSRGRPEGTGWRAFPAIDRAVLNVHLIVGVAVLATNLAAGLWGAWCWQRRRPSVAFWYLLRVAQVAVVVQVALGGALLLDGRESTDGLHYLYGVLPVLIMLLAEGARIVATEHETEGLDFESLPRERQLAVAVAVTRRETGIMAVSALVIFGLALRAYFTSPLG